MTESKRPTPADQLREWARQSDRYVADYDRRAEEHHELAVKFRADADRIRNDAAEYRAAADRLEAEQ